MPIKFRHDAAAVVVPSSASTRKYGQQLALQQQQLKYRAQQEGYDRLFQLQRDAQQNMAQARLQGEQNADRAIRDAEQRSFVMGRDEAEFERQREQKEAERQWQFTEDARKLSRSLVMKDIENGHYDTATANKLRTNLTEEAEALANKQLNDTQRAEVMQGFKEERQLLTANRLEKPAKPNAQEVLDESAVIQNGVSGQLDKNGLFVPFPQQKQQPMSFDEYVKQEPEKARAALDSKIAEIQKDIDREDTTLKDGETIEDRAFSELEKPFAAIRKRYGQPPKGYGTSSAAYYNDPKAPSPASPAAGMPVAPPDSGTPPSPTGGQQGSASSPQPSPSPQQVKVGGKPLVVTPGTLTPQETAARAQVMELPREQRIAALMPYDSELKGKTIEQILESPETKSQYDALTKQGLTTGNYREDMLTHIDEMLQNNVLNGAGQSQPDAYVGMNVNEITDPKVKAELEKLPRPKTAQEMQTIRGSLFIDPNGIVRGTQKQT